MNNKEIFNDGIKKLLNYKKQQHKLVDWFIYQEIKMNVQEALKAEGVDINKPENFADILCECVRQIPLSIPEGSVIASSQDAAFSPSYALINPSFQVETFAGYCDPLAVYDDIKTDGDFTAARIEKVRSYLASTPYVKNLNAIYEQTGNATREVAYFIEPVSGHTIPDMRPFIAEGVNKFVVDTSTGNYSATMKKALKAVLILAERYSQLAEKLIIERAADTTEVKRLEIIRDNCTKVPASGAQNLHEAVQAFALLWQVMCLEQAPNPYAFSVGKLDGILMPYLKNTPEDEAVSLVRHLLAFFMVGDRCWAISQNLLVGGMDENGNDLTNRMTYIVLDAFFKSNTPQPALSVRLHRKSPEKIYKSLGRFFFTPGHSTPSLFNDESMFKVLKNKNIDNCDLKDYAVAGCQEPLIMGKENANTTNCWLNTAKILELALNDGSSLISGEKIGLSWQEAGFEDAEHAYNNIEEVFWRQFDFISSQMEHAANACTVNLGAQAVPLSSALHGCLESGRDMRDPERPGTKYNGSGCLIHGLSIITDSIWAVKQYLKSGIGSAEDLRSALQKNYEDNEKLQSFLLNQDKYGNNITEIDKLAADLTNKICDKISSLENSSGKPFAPDFSTPSTHLLYGYWVGATPDGRKAREMLGYGIDPRPGAAQSGFQERIISNKVLPFSKMTGGYASHIGLAPEDFSDAESIEQKALAIRNRVIEPLFSFKSDIAEKAPFYVYFNIDEKSHLIQVLEEPEKFAPSGIYIMRIHGTFVNFLDLSPAIQSDIIERLDKKSSSLNIQV